MLSSPPRGERASETATRTRLNSNRDGIFRHHEHISPDCVAAVCARRAQTYQSHDTLDTSAFVFYAASMIRLGVRLCVPRDLDAGGARHTFER